MQLWFRHVTCKNKILLYFKILEDASTRYIVDTIFVIQWYSRFVFKTFLPYFIKNFNKKFIHMEFKEHILISLNCVEIGNKGNKFSPNPFKQ